MVSNWLILSSVVKRSLSILRKDKHDALVDNGQGREERIVRKLLYTNAKKCHSFGIDIALTIKQQR